MYTTKITIKTGSNVEGADFSVLTLSYNRNITGIFLIRLQSPRVRHCELSFSTSTKSGMTQETDLTRETDLTGF
jgi:hypothetical protein